MAIITKFGAPTTFEGLMDHLENGKMTPIERIQFADRDFGEWTVSEGCSEGDVVFFLCDGSVADELVQAFGAMEGTDDPAIITYLKRELILYKCYADSIMAVGRVAGEPVKVGPDQEFESMPGCWHANIMSFHRLMNPMSVSELGDFFTLNQEGGVTELDPQQSTKLLATIMFGNLR